MKRWLICLLTIALSAAIFAPTAPAASRIRVVVDGQVVTFPDEPPYVDRKSSRTMVPARFVAETLDAKMKWNGRLNQMTFAYRDQTVLLTIGHNVAQVNGKPVAFDPPATTKNNRTMIPLRLIGEIFQAQVEWDAKSNLAVVTTSAKIPKGTWIWDAGLIEKERDRILSFASEQDVTAIYLHVNRDIAPAVYEDFVRRATERQIRVEALAGRPEWALTTNRAPIKSFISWTLQYNASVGEEARFDGLHFDIEPYLLADWQTNSKRILEQWIHNLRWIEQEAEGSGLKMTMDVPYWLPDMKVPDTDYSLSAWLLEKFDCLVIMDYRNHALGNNGIVDNAHDILREASALNKQAIVAVETAKSLEGDRVSFYAKSAEYMEQELQTAHRELSQFAGYAGMAIHDYKSWAAMVGEAE
ncbi:copper amine oxidase N-terminal domain-containing protein [Cohnella cholangitidis]|uniref:Copper amine oxidase N-terminal domain-containing protein n=1 Tax=Cohnella cholangitidis TaxID=2598458 RepID=A0A7G5BWD5_9BACL|nr:copper amine oxidase N-terminal domain-containing protein [Cohnella cholangitidis]QMV41269.1 copper amine oxidase N-terminal domain-containing protein [Cohnella cholangitidis]